MLTGCIDPEVGEVVMTCEISLGRSADAVPGGLAWGGYLVETDLFGSMVLYPGDFNAFDPKRFSAAPGGQFTVHAKSCMFHADASTTTYDSASATAPNYCGISPWTDPNGG